jgi:hypothetical protein
VFDHLVKENDKKYKEKIKCSENGMLWAFYVLNLIKFEDGADFINLLTYLALYHGIYPLINALVMFVSHLILIITKWYPVVITSSTVETLTSIKPFIPGIYHINNIVMKVMIGSEFSAEILNI